MQMVISALAIIIFLGLTAYDTQKIREMVSVDGDTGREEVIGALTLYMDFINLFINLLQLFGLKKDWCGDSSTIWPQGSWDLKHFQH